MLRALLLLALVAPATAQGSDPVPSPEPAPPADGWTAWTSGGITYMVAPLFGGVRLSVGAEHRAAAFRLGYTHSAEFWSAAPVNVVSVSAGLRHRAGRLRLTALAGPAIVWGTAGQPYPRERYSEPGLVAETSALVDLGRFVALGVEAHAFTSEPLHSFGFGPTLRVRLAGDR